MTHLVVRPSDNFPKHSFGSRPQLVDQFNRFGEPVQKIYGSNNFDNLQFQLITIMLVRYIQQKQKPMLKYHVFFFNNNLTRNLKTASWST